MHYNSYTKNSILFYSFIIILFIVLYPIIVFDSLNKYNSVNFILYIISLLTVLFSINNIRVNNINSYNVFLFLFFISLFLNTLNLSTKQFLKTPEDLYIFLIGPMLIFAILYKVEKINFKLISFKNIIKINPNILYIILIIVYVGLKLYIGMKVGFRIYSYSDLSIIPSGSKYTIPGISGISAISQWLLIIFIPYVKKKYSIPAVILIIIFSGIMNVKRGDIIRILMFIMLYYLFIKIKFQEMTKKTIFRFALIIIIFMAVFVLFGQYRLEARGGESGLIIEYLGSRIDSVVISWLYSYMALNFEVLKLYYVFEPSYEMIHFYEIFGANLDRESIGLAVTISGFNAGTFIQKFMQDYGMFYYFELLLFIIVVAIIVIMSKKLNFIGLYLFLIMLMSLLIFTDYLFTRAIIMSILIAILIFPFLKTKNSIGIK